MNLLDAFDVGLNLSAIELDSIGMAEEVAEAAQSMQQRCCFTAQKSRSDPLDFKCHAVY